MNLNAQTIIKTVTIASMIQEKTRDLVIEIESHHLVPKQIEEKNRSEIKRNANQILFRNKFLPETHKKSIHLNRTLSKTYNLDLNNNSLEIFSSTPLIVAKSSSSPFRVNDFHRMFRSRKISTTSSPLPSLITSSIQSLAYKIESRKNYSFSSSLVSSSSTPFSPSSPSSPSSSSSSLLPIISNAFQSDSDRSSTLKPNSFDSISISTTLYDSTIEESTSIASISSSSSSSSSTQESNSEHKNEFDRDSFAENILLKRLQNVKAFDILIILIGGSLSLITILGNVLVMVAFKIDRNLQTITNYYLLSLAVADFLIGCISMPLSSTYILARGWPLGPVACDMWLAIDYLNSNASVLNLLLISFDRYFSVTRPLTYRAKRTTRKACLSIAFAWIISALLWPPWIFAWPSIEGRRTVPQYQCYIPFLESNIWVTTITALLAFWLPVTIMCVFYWQVWRETANRYRELTSLLVISPTSKHKSSSPSSSLSTERLRIPLSSSTQPIQTINSNVTPVSTSASLTRLTNDGNEDDGDGDDDDNVSDDGKDLGKHRSMNEKKNFSDRTRLIHSNEFKSNPRDNKVSKSNQKRFEHLPNCSYTLRLQQIQQFQRQKQNEELQQKSQPIKMEQNSHNDDDRLIKIVSKLSEDFEQKNDQGVLLKGFKQMSQKNCLLKSLMKRSSMSITAPTVGDVGYVCLTRPESYRNVNEIRSDLVDYEDHPSSSRTIATPRTVYPDPLSSSIERGDGNLRSFDRDASLDQSLIDILDRNDNSFDQNLSKDTKNDDDAVEDQIIQSKKFKIFQQKDSQQKRQQKQHHREQRSIWRRFWSFVLLKNRNDSDVNLKNRLRLVEPFVMNVPCREERREFEQPKSSESIEREEYRKYFDKNFDDGSMIDLEDGEMRKISNNKEARRDLIAIESNQNCPACRYLQFRHRLRLLEREKFKSTIDDVVDSIVESEMSANQLKENDSNALETQTLETKRAAIKKGTRCCSLSSCCRIIKRSSASSSSSSAPETIASNQNRSDDFRDKKLNDRNGDDSRGIVDVDDVNSVNNDDVGDGGGNKVIEKNLVVSKSQSKTVTKPKHSGRLKSSDSCEISHQNPQKSIESIKNSSQIPFDSDQIIRVSSCSNLVEIERQKFSSIKSLKQQRSATVSSRNQSLDQSIGSIASQNTCPQYNLPHNHNQSRQIPSSQSSSAITRVRATIQPKSERKAAKTLSAILLAFIVTWTPYNVLVLVKTFSPGSIDSDGLWWQFAYYLCYINSTLNPLLYALCNANFRRTYVRILTCKFRRGQQSVSSFGQAALIAAQHARRQQFREQREQRYRQQQRQQQQQQKRKFSVQIQEQKKSDQSLQQQHQQHRSILKSSKKEEQKHCNLEEIDGDDHGGQRHVEHDGQQDDRHHHNHNHNQSQHHHQHQHQQQRKNRV
ncbi:hypothetical protein NH340_JMT07974 [Sarcoptes scabiei]|nr:hypothetical protein NH340_JMT07974 [Sarcoptes scabiei]